MVTAVLLSTAPFPTSPAWWNIESKTASLWEVKSVINLLKLCNLRNMKRSILVSSVAPFLVLSHFPCDLFFFLLHIKRQKKDERSFPAPGKLLLATRLLQRHECNATGQQN
jgi:hypothetical protein